MARTKHYRNRGGGRGGATAASQAQAIDEQPPAVAQQPLSTPPNETDDTIAVSRQDVSQPQVSPNLSPASAPTETPAPTPARPPIQRLESILPGQSSSTSSRGTSSRGRYKPRAVRRDKDERDKAEQEEWARIKTRESELRAQGVGIASAASRGALGRGVARGFARGRGRGDAMGRGKLQASGLFGIAPSAPDKRPVPGVMNSSSSTEATGIGRDTSKTNELGPRTRASAASTLVKQEPSHDGLYSADVDMYDGIDAKPKAEIPEPVYPEEKRGARPAPRVDIEHINLVSDSDDEVIFSRKGKGTALPSSDKGGLRPVRLHRKEHKERTTTVNTETAHTELVESSDDGGGDVMVINGDVANRSAVGGNRWTDAKGIDGNGLQVKYDPETAADPMDVDSELNMLPEQPTGDASMKPHKTKSKSVRKPSTKNKQPVLQTEEEKAEYRRHEEDTKILLDEFHKLQTTPAKRASFGQEDGPADTNSNGRLYLFQFPPILPPLLNPVQIKEEKDDMEMLDARALPLGGASKAADSNPEEVVVIKADPDGPAATQGTSGHFTEAGYIGKLVVRESGKVELNWGGTSLQLGRGAAFDFLTTTMVINNESGASMGPVMGKFVATPDWDRMFDMA